MGPPDDWFRAPARKPAGAQRATCSPDPLHLIRAMPRRASRAARIRGSHAVPGGPRRLTCTHAAVPNARAAHGDGEAPHRRRRGDLVSGEAIAHEIGLRTDDPAVHDAFREIYEREELDVGAWRGGPGLPAEVRLRWQIGR